jgi:hypothetical protein
MILYVNGDSHSAGAEAVNPHAFAEDDPLYWALGRKPHPDNEKVSYGCGIANLMGAILVNEAESASSNDRIFRTTYDYLKDCIAYGDLPDAVIIGWSTWEREEWTYNDDYYQVTASGTDDVPQPLHDRYKRWVIEQSDSDIINNKLIEVHNQIWRLHNTLSEQNIPHLFFNTYSHFANIEHLGHLGAEKKDWGDSYLNPYDPEYTYYNWLRSIQTHTILAQTPMMLGPNTYSKILSKKH